MNAERDSVNILIIDDEAGIRHGLQRIIEHMGCRAFTAKDAEAGQDILKREDVAVVLLDLNLPSIDGMDFLGTLLEHYPHVVTIALAGFATIETAVKAMQQGAYDFLTKPFEPDHLRQVIQRAWEKVLLAKQAQLAQQKEEYASADRVAENNRLSTVVDLLPIGLLVTNAQCQVVLANPAFFQLLGLSEETELGLSIEHYIQDETVCRLVRQLSQGCSMDANSIADHEFSPNSDRYLVAHGRPAKMDANVCLGAVVTFEDITAMKVIDRLKSEFVAKVTHELRSPLATIHEQLAMVLNDLVGRVPPNDAHLLTRAKEKTQGLISLIGDLLDLSRIESGAVCQVPQPVVLEELMANIIDFLSTRAAAKQQRLSLHQPRSALPPINADPLALESIFGNLITNAINYTPENGRIDVRLSQADTHVQVEVSDNGLGMENRHLEKIFDRFYRVKTEYTRYITGTGLGLPIVKGLLEALGGTIRVQSAPDEGSTFTVLLPWNQTREEKS